MYKLARHFPKTIKVATVFYKGGNKLTMLDESLLSLLMEKFNFQSDIFQPTDKEYGRPTGDGNWTGIVGLVQKEEADFGLGKLAITEQRSFAVDFSYPYLYSPTTFITDKPRRTSKIYAAFSPFPPLIWCLIFVSIAIVAFIFYSSRNHKRNSQCLILLINGILLGQSVKLKFNKFSTKFLITFWMVFALIINFSYKAVLLSSLTFPVLIGIQDIAQLTEAAEDPSFKCSTFGGNIVYSLLQNSDDPSWNNIAECMTRSQMFTDDIEPFLHSSSYKKAFIALKSIIAPYSKGYFISDDTFYTNMMAIAVRKKFCCKEDVDQFIHKISAFGILDKLINEEEFFTTLNRNYSETIEEDHRKLSLFDVAGAFIVLMFGYLSACTVFILEILLFRKTPVNV